MEFTAQLKLVSLFPTEAFLLEVAFLSEPPLLSQLSKRRTNETIREIARTKDVATGFILNIYFLE
jgi:hypothetical protein